MRVGDVKAAGMRSYVAKYVVTNTSTKPICLSTKTVNPQGISQGEVVKFVLPDGSEKHVRDYPGFPSREAKAQAPRVFSLSPGSSVTGAASVPVYLSDLASKARFVVIVPATDCRRPNARYLNEMDVGFRLQPEEQRFDAAKSQAIWAKSGVTKLPD